MTAELVRGLVSVRQSGLKSVPSARLTTLIEGQLTHVKAFPARLWQIGTSGIVAAGVVLRTTSITSRKRVVAGSTLILLLTLFTLSLTPASAGADDAVCLECHDGPEAVLGFFHESGDVSCTSCHGDSAEHIERPRNATTTPFHEPSDTATGNGVCLTCHDNESMIHWDTAAHGAADVACNGCHNVHAKIDLVMTGAAQNEVCMDCHRDVATRFKLPSTHPVAVNKTRCTDCHASHGSASDGMLTGASPVETCTACHSELRGPFLFEHEPVTEDCGHCHEPHGSVQPALLNARQPFMCQQCHLAANHPSRLADGSALSAREPNLLIKGCVTCHSQVHGSNHPSGARLTR